MAEVKLSDVFATFPIGTAVKAYERIVFDAGHPKPVGASIDEAVVAADGSLTFTALTLDGSSYYAAAQVEDEWRFLQITTSTPEGAGISELVEAEAATRAAADTAASEALSAEAKAREEADAAHAAVLAASGKGYVSHDEEASKARPSGFASIEWHGSVEPENAANGDTWLDYEVGS